MEYNQLSTLRMRTQRIVQFSTLFPMKAFEFCCIFDLVIFARQHLYRCYLPCPEMHDAFVEPTGPCKVKSHLEYEAMIAYCYPIFILTFKFKACNQWVGMAHVGQIWFIHALLYFINSVSPHTPLIVTPFLFYGKFHLCISKEKLQRRKRR